MTIVQSWNTALKGDLSSDYPVGTTWAMDGGNYYLLDLVRVRAAIPKLIKRVLSAAASPTSLNLLSYHRR